MAQTSVGHVFMSYSRRDEAVMRRIATFLRKRGLIVWVDNEKLIPGTPIWEAEIEKAIKGASAIVVVLSPDSKNSEWVRREITLAEQHHKRIFPVLVRGEASESIYLRLITSQYVDIRQNERSGLNMLNTALALYLEELETQEKQTQQETERIAQVKPETAERFAQEKAAQEQAVVVKSEETQGLRKIISLTKHSPTLRIIAISGVFVALVIAGLFANNIFKSTENIGPSSEATQVPVTVGERAWGLNVSFYEGQINWNRVTNEGIDFAVVKATEGTSVIDTKFQENWDTLKQLEIPRGAYLFFQLDEDPKQQADFFASQVTFIPGDLPPVLDFEVSGELENDEILSKLQTVLAELELKTGRRPILYTGYFFLKENLRDSSGNYPSWLTSYPLWIAQYPNDVTNIQSQQPDLPPGWEGGWLFWHYTDNGTVNGVETHVNMNLFNGSPVDLQNFLGKPRVWGIDVSTWEDNIDWTRVKGMGINFAYVGATNGTDNVDRKFQKNWDSLAQLGIPKGAYFSFHGDEDPKQQVELFVNTIHPSPGDLPPAILVEFYGNETIDNQTLQTNLKIALSELERATGRQPIIYSSPGFMNDKLADQSGEFPEWLTTHPLWIANYLTDVTDIQTKQPMLPAGWTNGWLFWQYTDQGKVTGIDSTVDLNVFNGSATDLQQLLNTP